jgi:hypothetical protein
METAPRDYAGMVVPTAPEIKDHCGDKGRAKCICGLATPLQHQQEKAEENLNVRVGDRIFAIGSYREKFYRPDLVKLSLAGSSLSQLGFAGIDSVKVAAIVELVDLPASVSDQKRTINLRITDAGGGIGLVVSI